MGTWPRFKKNVVLMRPQGTVTEVSFLREFPKLKLYSHAGIITSRRSFNQGTLLTSLNSERPKLQTCVHYFVR